MKRQEGTTTVEMALVGAAFFLVFFAVMEVGRLFYTLHGLTEATRRGARIAAVCPLNHPAIKNVAIFGDPATGSGRLIKAITTDKVAIAYLDQNGNETADFGSIRYVRASIEAFQHQMIIPGFAEVFSLPRFSTTLPRESLGVPRDGVVECEF